MKKTGFILAAGLCMAVLSGCSLFATATPAPTPQPTATITAAATEIPLPTMAPTLPTPPPTPAPTATPSPVMMINAEVTFDNYLLRVGPGRLFERVAMYDTGAIVNIIGREAGNNWVLVQTQDDRAGWMNVVGLTYLGDIISLPVFIVNNAQILHGHVWNVDKSPANLIGISLQPLNNSNPDLMEHVMTGDTGAWFAYLPINTLGEWQVGPDSYGCPANVAAGECSIVGNLPPAQTVTLPVAANVGIEFNILP